MRSKISADSTLKYLSYSSQKTAFDKLTSCMTCQSLFSGKNSKNSISLSSAELPPEYGIG